MGDDDIMSNSEFEKSHAAMAASSRQKKMRTSVSAEAYGNWNKKENFTAPVYPKNEQQKRRLSETLRKSFMFGGLSQAEMNTIVDAMTEVHAVEGERLVKLGDNGDYLFVIEQGLLECRKEINGVDTLLKTVETGDVFGELALLYNTVRAANVDARTPCVLWKLDRASFTHIVAGSAQRKREKYENFLSEVPLLQHMDAYSRSQLCDGLRVESFKAGETIIREGDEGHSFYVLESGQAEAVKKGMEGKPMSYSPGSFFGELALLKHTNRAATVTALTGVDCLVLDRSAFRRLFGGSQALSNAFENVQY